MSAEPNGGAPLYYEIHLMRTIRLKIRDVDRVRGAQRAAEVRGEEFYDYVYRLLSDWRKHAWGRKRLPTLDALLDWDEKAKKAG